MLPLVLSFALASPPAMMTEAEFTYRACEAERENKIVDGTTAQGLGSSAIMLGSVSLLGLVIGIVSLSGESRSAARTPFVISGLLSVALVTAGAIVTSNGRASQREGLRTECPAPAEEIGE